MEKIKSLFKRLSWFPFFIAAAIVTAIFFPSISQFLDLREQARKADIKIGEVQLKKHLLEEEEDKIQNDSYYIEKLAREKLGVVKKGEVLYKIVPAVNEEPTSR
jgi:cell division protein FtsB